jgi:hypothetical protein
MNHYSRFAAGFLAIALLSAPAIGSAQGYGSNNNDRGQFNGVISSVNGNAIALQNGTTVFLHNGTVINPGGTRLQPGMRISITGSQAANGNIDANEVDVVRGNRYNNGYNNGSYNGQYNGVISTVSSGALGLQDGKTIFLKNGTVINPSGTHFQPGMHISVSGTDAGNGNINATEIVVTGENGYNR